MTIQLELSEKRARYVLDILDNWLEEMQECYEKFDVLNLEQDPAEHLATMHSFRMMEVDLRSVREELFIKLRRAESGRKT